MGKEYILKAKYNGHSDESGRYNQGKPTAIRKFNNAVKRARKYGGGTIELLEYTYGPPPNYKFMGSKTIKRTKI